MPRATESPLKKFASIESPGFQKWSNVNMYRTSYNDMSNKVSDLEIYAKEILLVDGV